MPILNTQVVQLEQTEEVHMKLNKELDKIRYLNTFHQDNKVFGPKEIQQSNKKDIYKNFCVKCSFIYLRDMAYL